MSGPVARFAGFAVIAEMRTGSNLLESVLNALPGVACHGELFNRNFIGRPNRGEAFGIDEAAREKDPAALLRAMRESGPGLMGFRWFSDHDPRVLPMLLGDPACAIVRLRRNPAEVWISRQIARATGQWKLGDLRQRKSAKVVFDRDEFAEYLNVRDTFERDFHRRLQVAGRTAFWIDYADLANLDVLNGLAAWLGVEARLEALPTEFRKQNPGELSDKVENPGEMAAALQELGVPGDGSDGFRPLPGPGVPGWMIATRAPLLIQPIPGGPEAALARWLETVDGAAPVKAFRQKALRAWQEANPHHRAVTVVRHPLLRAFAALKEERTRQLAPVLARYGVRPGPATSESLMAWLAFLGGALAGQVSVIPERSWRPQAELIASASAVRPPDLILREEEMADRLPAFGNGTDLPPDPETEALRAELSAIVTPKAERLARRAYRGDFRTFGYGDWSSGGG